MPSQPPNNFSSELFPRYDLLRPGVLVGFVVLLLVYLNLPDGISPESFKRDCEAAITRKLKDVAPDQYSIEGQPSKQFLIRNYTMNFRVLSAATGVEMARGSCVVAKDSRAGDRTVLYRYVPQSP